MRDALGERRPPDVRLALGTSYPSRYDSLFGPSVRFAITTHSGSMSPQNIARALAPPEVRLAHAPGAQGDNSLIGRRGVKQLPPESAPALLVSFVYLEPFLKVRQSYIYRDWALDSGAYSAHNSGQVIDLQKYTDTARRLLAEDPKLSEVFALDVIGDWRASIQNTEKMWKSGVEAIPCYHFADRNWDVLKGLARDYPKVAIGGMAHLRGHAKTQFMEQVFARVWPKKLHGFGAASPAVVLGFPWHSVDATNWEVGACKFGRWKAYGGRPLSIRGSSQNLRVEVEYFLRMEREARSKWAREMQLLEDATGPNVRLAEVKSAPTRRKFQKQ